MSYMPPLFMRVHILPTAMRRGIRLWVPVFLIWIYLCWWIVLSGAALGVGLSAGASRLLASLLPEIARFDLAVVTGAVVLGLLYLLHQYVSAPF